MSEFKYLTPYWKNSQTLYGEGITDYTGTYFYILNPNSTKTSVEIYFYDLNGQEYLGMRTGIFLQPHAVWDLRIIDIISIHDPEYKTSDYIRAGSIKIICDAVVVVSGRITSGRVNSLGVRVEDSWSIPFTEFVITPIERKTIYRDPQEIVDGKTLEDYLKKRRHK